MDYFFPFLLFLLYKLAALIPLVVILIAIIKLHRHEKNSGTRLMLTGNLGLIIKVTLIDTIMDYFVRFESSAGVVNISTIYTVLGFVAIIFSILFASGFLIFVITLQKNNKIDNKFF